MVMKKITVPTNMGMTIQIREDKITMTTCVFGEKIYTGKSLVKNAYLVFNGQRIVGVTKTKRGELLGNYPVVTPAFIDAHSHIGVVRAGEPSVEAEANEHMDTVLALADVLDSVQMDDQAFRDAVELGVLYSCVLPGSGNIIGGRSAVVRHYAKNSTEALVCRAGVKAAFGHNPMATQDWKGTRPSTRMGALAILRKRLDQVRQAMDKHRRARGKKKDDIVFSAEDKVLRDLLTKREVLRAHVHKTDDIALVLRLADEFKLNVSVEHAMDVAQPEIFEALRKQRIPVVYGPLDAFPYKVELKHYSWRNIRYLLQSKVSFGLMSDHPVTPAGSLLIQTRWFLRAGLTKQQALEMITRQNADILGLTSILGSLQKGRWASFVCWNGDPFDLTRYPVAVYGEGALVFSE
jgi:imidazolonepropionase-like amidohydrolase